jgi:hypothetical protein
VEVVDLYLLFQILQKYARIMGAMGGGSRLKMVKNGGKKRSK